MIDKALVTSGFDMEMLVTEKYLQYMLFCLFETGTIPNTFSLTDENHISKGTVVVYAPSELASSRLYEPNPDFEDNQSTDRNSFSVTILPEERLAMFLVIGKFLYAPANGSVNFDHLELKIFIDAFLTSQEINGVQQNLLLNLTVVDVGGNLIENINNLPPGFNLTKQDILENLNHNISPTVDLGIIGPGKRIQRVETRLYKATEDRPSALGIYINLKLKKGPEPDNFITDSGHVNNAQNFLPIDQNIAFVMNGNLFDKLANDIKFKSAQIYTPLPDIYYYPLRKNNDIIGRLVDVSVGTFLESNSDGEENSSIGSGALQFNIHIELFSQLGDPDFHIKVILKPLFDEHGFMDWDVKYQTTGTLLDVLTVLEILIIPHIPYLFTDDIREALTSPVKDKFLASGFLNAFPDKLKIESKRWDPLYDTLQKVVSSLTQMDITNDGIFMAGQNLFLGREFKPDPSAVIRDKIRNPQNEVTALTYRVPVVKNPKLLKQNFASTDRMPVSEIIDPENSEPYLVTVALDQIINRIEVGKIVKNIPYQPFKIKLQDNQIDQILCLSSLELAEKTKEIHDRIKDEIFANELQIYVDRTALTFSDLGIQPTQSETDELLNMYIEAETSQRLQIALDEELSTYLKFDLRPDEFKFLQDKLILTLVNKIDQKPFEVIRMGNGTIYFRDRADNHTKDNLLSLPHYSAED